MAKALISMNEMDGGDSSLAWIESDGDRACEKGKNDGGDGHEKRDCDLPPAGMLRK